MTHRRKAFVATLISTAISVAIVGCVAPNKAMSSSSGQAQTWGTTSPSTNAPAPLQVPADFVVGVIVTEQKCFGSAGCTYHYTINPQYISAKPLPGQTTVVFTVTGGEQNQVGNFTIDEYGTATFDRETMISGSEGADLRATVTQVIPGR